MTDTNQLIVNFRGGVGEVDETPEETKQKARLTVCRLAKDPADAVLLLDILGLKPDRKPEPPVAQCKECDAPMGRQAVAGIKKAGRDGLCVGCTQRAEKATKPPRNYVRTAPSRKRGQNPGECDRCGRVMASRSVAQPGQLRYGGKGLCEPCYQNERRQVAKAVS